MSRALLVFLALFSLPAYALEYAQFIRLYFSDYESVSYQDFLVPGDSILRLEITATGNGYFRLNPRTGRSDSVWHQRFLWNAGPCVISNADTTCLKPQSTFYGMIFSSASSGTCFYHPAESEIKGSWSVERAIRMLRSNMSGPDDWGVLSAWTVGSKTFRPGGPNRLGHRVAEWYWNSPWSRRDLISANGQFFHVDSAYPGQLQDTFLVNPRQDWMWSFNSTKSDTSKFVRADFSYQNSSGMCSNEHAPLGSRWLHAGRNRPFSIVDDSVNLDSAVGNAVYAPADGWWSTVLRARVALKDLDSLLRNPPAVGVSTIPLRSSPLHISGTKASLEAGASPGRMELVDARGQILSKVTGTGRLALDIHGHGLRWVRWTRGLEQGTQAVVF